MKILIKGLGLIILLVFTLYLFLPSPGFPTPPPDAIQSDEPADTESSARRAYFTNYSRDEVLNHYQSQFSKLSFISFIPTYRLNYPPEEAQVIIRDQTRSTFLEEIVHPFRESLFINGFEPKDSKDAIFIEGKNWRQKIIVKLFPSNILVRTALGIVGALLTVLLGVEWLKTFKKILGKEF